MITTPPSRVKLPSGIESNGIWVVVLIFLFVSGKNMAIGGVVITVHPDERRDVEIALAEFSELSVYGSDEKGNIIATIKSVDSKSIERVIQTIETLETVCKVSLAYLNTENESDSPVNKG